MLDALADRQRLVHRVGRRLEPTFEQAPCPCRRWRGATPAPRCGALAGQRARGRAPARAPARSPRSKRSEAASIRPISARSREATRRAELRELVGQRLALRQTVRPREREVQRVERLEHRLRIAVLARQRQRALPGVALLTRDESQASRVATRAASTPRSEPSRVAPPRCRRAPADRAPPSRPGRRSRSPRARSRAARSARARAASPRSAPRGCACARRRGGAPRRARAASRGAARLDRLAVRERRRRPARSAAPPARRHERARPARPRARART